MEFNFHRFLLTLKRDIITNRKVYINLFLGMFIVYVLASLVLMMQVDTILEYKNLSEEAQKAFEAGNIYNFTNMCLLILYIFMLITVSQLAFDRRRKPERINAIMLPASKSEKILSRWVILVPGMLLAGCVAFICADLLRVLVQPMLCDFYIASAIPAICERFGFAKVELEFADPSNTTRQLLSETGSTLLPIFIHATYLLGGALFKKRAALITTLIYIGGMMAFVLVVKQVLDMTGSSEFWISFVPGTTYYALLDLLLLVGIGGCAWFAGKRFGQMQVV